MSKSKHLLDWYIDNTPSDEKEYDRGILTVMSILGIIWGTLFVGILIIS